MNNQNLNFFHEIPIEVYHETDNVLIEIFVNNVLVYEKEYSPGKVHSETVSFYYEYLNSSKNCLKIKFNGKTEVRNKYLKIKSVAINQVWLNLYNCNYKPDLNPNWWNRLTAKQKDAQLAIIYGRRGPEFGWFGEISFDFAAGIDSRSTFMLKNNIDTILSKKIDWVFLDKSNNKKWELKSNDKLL